MTMYTNNKIRDLNLMTNYRSTSKKKKSKKHKQHFFPKVCSGKGNLDENRLQYFNR